MGKMPIRWTCITFEALTNTELYAILRLRSEVFVVEQNCVFLDMDNKDQFSLHLCGWDTENELAAVVRIIPPGKIYSEMSIGRVVTSAKHRGTGIGRELMKVGIAKCYELFGQGPIRIGAQVYLRGFYESLGFVQSGEIYDEDGIDHMEMVRG